MKRFKRFGPFSYFKVKGKFISAWLTSREDWQFGWEIGSDGTGSNPSVCLRIAHFNIFSFEKYKSGFTIFILGFWYMV